MFGAVNLGEPLGRRGGDQRTPFPLDGHERGAVLIDPVLAPLGVSGPVRTVELERIETLVDRGKTDVAEQVAERRLRQPERARVVEGTPLCRLLLLGGGVLVVFMGVGTPIGVPIPSNS